MNKLKILSILPALVLCSCGAKKNKFAGTYQFRLGKSDGNHMEVTATITDDDDAKVEGYKVMTLSGDLGDQFNIMTQIEELEDILDDIVAEIDPTASQTRLDELSTLVTAVKEELKNTTSIPFFYKVTEYKNAKYGQRLELGTHYIADLVDSIIAKKPELEEVVNDLKGFLALTQLFEDNLFIMPAVSKYVFNAFVNKKGLTFQVPISKDDLDQQFIWYGFYGDDKHEMIWSDVDLPDDYMSKMPGTKGETRFGTHPEKVIRNNVVVSDEQEMVNKTFAYEFSKSPLYESDNTEEVNELARFYLDDSGESKKLYLKFPEEFEAKQYIGYIGTSERKEIKLTVDKDGLCNVRPNGETGIKAGFLDDDGTNFRFSDVIDDPFEFRDFNVVDVGLNKVEL